MSEIALKWLRGLRFTHPELVMTQGQFNVIHYLAEKHHPVSGNCQASESEIARENRLTDRHVRRTLTAHLGTGALLKWEKGKSKSWASRFEFGLGFVFVPLAQTRQLRTSCPATPDIPSSNSGHPVQPYKERNKANLKDENQALKQHSFAAPKEEVPHPNQTSALNAAMATWLQIKEKLKATLPTEDWNLWVRPMYLFRLMADGFLLFTLPANNRMLKAARDNQAMLTEVLRENGYAACSFTTYPDEYQLDRMFREAPEFYEQLPEALKKRRPAKVSA
jgi:hypothetical protein